MIGQTRMVHLYNVMLLAVIFVYECSAELEANFRKRSLAIEPWKPNQHGTVPQQNSQWENVNSEMWTPWNKEKGILSEKRLLSTTAAAEPEEYVDEPFGKRVNDYDSDDFNKRSVLLKWKRSSFDINSDRVQPISSRPDDFYFWQSLVGRNRLLLPPFIRRRRLILRKIKEQKKRQDKKGNFKPCVFKYCDF